MFWTATMGIIIHYSLNFTWIFVAFLPINDLSWKNHLTKPFFERTWRDSALRKTTCQLISLWRCYHHDFYLTTIEGKLLLCKLRNNSETWIFQGHNCEGWLPDKSAFMVNWCSGLVVWIPIGSPKMKGIVASGNPKPPTQTTTLWLINIAMENGPFEDVFLIKNWDIPLLC